MVLGDFYKVNKLEVEDLKAKAYVTINKSHEIFKGHFPNNPITPGVCMMQIIKEITEGIVGKSLIMESSTNVKFSAIINPEINPDLVLSIDITQLDDVYKVKNVTQFGDTVALKLTSQYKTK